MKNIFAFTDIQEAKTTLVKVLGENDWEKSFLTDQNGELIDIYTEKEKARAFNDITPYGGFDNEEQAYETLRDCLILQLDEIAEWLVKGTNQPLKLFYNFNRPTGYCFDREGNEYRAKKVQLCLRKDRKNNTHFGMFVSHFHPIYEFIK